MGNTELSLTGRRVIKSSSFEKLAMSCWLVTASICLAEILWLLLAVSKHGHFFLFQSKDGKTPLHMTAIHGRFSRSQTIIQNGKKRGRGGLLLLNTTESCIDFQIQSTHSRTIVNVNHHQCYDSIFVTKVSVCPLSNYFLL